MKPPVIAVTGINATENPSPGTGIARSLHEDNQLSCRIIGLAYDAMEPGLYNGLKNLQSKNYIVDL
jgi:carbamoyl-phosphate synthase large subunit